MNKPLLPALALALATITLTANAQAPSAGQPTATQPANTDSKINGRWHFVLTTDGGDRDFLAQLTVDTEGKVTGTWEKAAVAGTYKDGHLQLAFDTFSEEANETSQLTIDGKLEDPATDPGTLTGNWTFSSYQGTFKATRPKT